MKKRLIPTLVLSSFVLSACNDKTPSCDAKESIELTKESLSKEIMGAAYYLWQLPKEELSEIWRKAEITDIRTQKHDEKQDIYLCAANINLSLSEDKISSLINEGTRKIEDKFSKKIDEERKSIENKISNEENEFKNNINELTLKFESDKESLNIQEKELDNSYHNAKENINKKYLKSISDFENSMRNRDVSTPQEKDSINRMKQAIVSDKENNLNKIETEYVKTKDWIKNTRKDLQEEFNRNVEYRNNSYNDRISSLNDELSNLSNKIEKQKEENINMMANQYKKSIKNLGIYYKLERSTDKKSTYVTTKID